MHSTLIVNRKTIANVEPTEANGPVRVGVGLQVPTKRRSLLKNTLSHASSSVSGSEAALLERERWKRLVREARIYSAVARFVCTTFDELESVTVDLPSAIFGCVNNNVIW